MFGLPLTTDNLSLSLKQKKKKKIEEKILKNHQVFFNPEQSKPLAVYFFCSFQEWKEKRGFYKVTKF